MSQNSLEDAIPYYRDKGKMEGIGYAFRFTKEGAREFCQRQENTFGIPAEF
jgi:hypothetical protein